MTSDLSAIDQVLPAEGGGERVRSPWAMVVRRYWRNKLAVFGLGVLLVLGVACFGGIPWAVGQRAEPGAGGKARVAAGDAKAVSRYEDHMDLKHVREAPSREFWMGTDALGQDLRARFLLGGAISLSLGIASAVIAVVIGTGVGLWAGYVGGRTDALLMRVVDVLYGLPYILLVILMRVALVPGMTDFFLWLGEKLGWGWMKGSIAGTWANFVVLLVGIGSVSWLTLARVVRGQVMSLREMPYVEAARAMGFGWGRIMGRHILPNLVGTIIVYGTLTVPAAVLSESFLSFLGMGIQPPLPSWGNLASDGTEALNPVAIRWWLITWPCLGLSLALLALNFVGDGVREAVDPRGT